jgi:hypothetical protein
VLEFSFGNSEKSISNKDTIENIETPKKKFYLVDLFEVRYLLNANS